MDSSTNQYQQWQYWQHQSENRGSDIARRRRRVEASEGQGGKCVEIQREEAEQAIRETDPIRS